MSLRRPPALPLFIVMGVAFCTAALAARQLVPAGESATMLPRLFGQTVLVALIGGFLLSRANRPSGEAANRAADDATATRAALAELAAVNAELARQNRELDDFTAVAAHDLKEPLHGIGAYCGLLLEQNQHQLDDEGRRKMATMAELCGRLTQLIDDLLGYCRAGQRADLADIELADVLTGVLTTLEPAIEARRGTVRRIGPLPRVRGDATLLAGALRNLISNGLKFNDRPSAVVEIRWLEGDVERGQAAPLSASDSHLFRRIDRAPAAPPVVAGAVPPSTPSRATPPMVTVAVRDNGIGIEPRHQEAVFAMFRRLHHRRKYEGTGAGLAIVRKVIERHGGQIWLESTPGDGTTLYFTLPAAADAALPERSSGAMPASFVAGTR
jgi:two-component system, chemotaxis family, sensor kinase Cph1